MPGERFSLAGFEVSKHSDLVRWGQTIWSAPKRPALVLVGTLLMIIFLVGQSVGAEARSPQE